MKTNNIFAGLGLMFIAQQSVADATTPLGVPAPMPLEMGGVAAIAAVSLMIGTQLIKRRKK